MFSAGTETNQWQKMGWPWFRNSRLQIFFKTMFRLQTLLKRDSCEYCEIFKNTRFYRTSPVAAFVDSKF